MNRKTKVVSGNDHEHIFTLRFGVVLTDICSIFFFFLDWNGGTLVVCPASVIRQWEDEINKFTNYALNVCLHHGERRSVSARELISDDIVITTYGIVRTEIEKVSDGDKCYLVAQSSCFQFIFSFFVCRMELLRRYDGKELYWTKHTRSETTRANNRYVVVG